VEADAAQQSWKRGSLLRDRAAALPLLYTSQVEWSLIALSNQANAAFLSPSAGIDQGDVKG